MKKSNIQTVSFRRKKEGKTNYKTRIKLITSGKPRLVVRKTLSKIITQIIVFDVKGDEIKLGVDSTALKKLGWEGSFKSTPAAYLTGYLIGKKCLENKINEAVFDIGFSTALKGTKIFAVLKGAIDAGLNVPCSKEVFPSEDRINGKAIKDFKNNVEEIKGKIK